MCVLCKDHKLSYKERKNYALTSKKRLVGLASGTFISMEVICKLKLSKTNLRFDLNCLTISDQIGE